VFNGANSSVGSLDKVILLQIVLTTLSPIHL